ncbi:hypothetical protein [Sphingomonas oryzagri]
MQEPILTTRDAVDHPLIEADDVFLTSMIHWALLKAPKGALLKAGSKSTWDREVGLRILVKRIAEQFGGKVLLKRDYGNVAHSIGHGYGTPPRAASDCNADAEPR